MLNNYALDARALERDPNLKNLQFEAGTHAPAFNQDVGQRIYALATSRFGVAALIGAVASAPSRPPVVALEPLLLSEVGDAAFSDEMKQLTGRIVRFVIEHVGGRWQRRGIKIPRNSRYKSGSVYSLTF